MTSSRRKFVMDIPRFSRPVGRVRAVGGAVARVAEMLGSDIEVSQGTGASIWVYYMNSIRERFPVYVDYGKNLSEDEVFESIMGGLEELYVVPKRPILQVAQRR